MPYSKCPVCGAVSHLSVGDVQRWYAEHYPGMPVGSLVPSKCFNCWPELRTGDGVVVRPPLAEEPQAEAGARGVIQEVLSAPEQGNIYAVRLASGEERYFIRAELRKQREGEAQ